MTGLPVPRRPRTPDAGAPVSRFPDVPSGPSIADVPCPEPRFGRSRPPCAPARKAGSRTCPARRPPDRARPGANAAEHRRTSSSRRTRPRRPGIPHPGDRAPGRFRRVPCVRAPAADGPVRPASTVVPVRSAPAAAEPSDGSRPTAAVRRPEPFAAGRPAASAGCATRPADAAVPGPFPAPPAPGPRSVSPCSRGPLARTRPCRAVCPRRAAHTSAHAECAAGARRHGPECAPVVPSSRAQERP